MKKLSPQTVLITGASSGIGKELSMVFARNGFNLVLISRTEVALHELAATIIQHYSVKALVIAKDLAQPHACYEIKEILDQNQIAIDVLINNAGFGICEHFAHNSIETYSEMIAVNIQALTLLTRLLLPSMIQRGFGKIVNVASVVAFAPLPFMSTYSASKAYVLSFSRTIAEELRGTGVNIVVVCPGLTKTKFYERSQTNEIKRLLQLPQMSAQIVAEMAFKAIMKNKQIAVIGILNKIVVVILPIIYKIFGMRLIRYFMDGMINHPTIQISSTTGK